MEALYSIGYRRKIMSILLTLYDIIIITLLQVLMLSALLFLRLYVQRLCLNRE